MMNTYTRRGPGQSFLKQVLAEKINSLIELKDVDLEINPLKVYESMVTQIQEDTGTLPAYLPKSGGYANKFEVCRDGNIQMHRIRQSAP